MNFRKISAKKNPLSLADIALWVLLFSMALAFTKPAVAFLSGHRELAAEFAADYGIPSRWKSSPGSGSILPDGSIGLDFLCVDIYLRCAGPGVEIYKKFCPGDPSFRPYGYPPLMSYFMLWLLFFSTRQAIGIWSIFILLSVFLAVFFLLRSKTRHPLMLAALFTLSYPSLFSYDRGNNDIWVLWLLFAGVFAISKNKWFLLGMVLSATALLKIFPVTLWAAFFTACVLLAMIGIFLKNPELKKINLPILLGQAVAGLAVILPLLREHVYYFTHQLDILRLNLSKTIYPGDKAINHSLIMGFGKFGFILGAVLWLTAVVALAIFLYHLSTDPKQKNVLKEKLLFSFSYLALLMTYLPNINSFDYNLILGLPFFCIVIAQENIWPKNTTGIAFFLLLLGTTLPRWVHLLLPAGMDTAYLWLETAGLVLFAAIQIKTALYD